MPGQKQPMRREDSDIVNLIGKLQGPRGAAAEWGRNIATVRPACRCKPYELQGLVGGAMDWINGGGFFWLSRGDNFVNNEGIRLYKLSVVLNVGRTVGWQTWP